MDGTTPRPVAVGRAGEFYANLLEHTHDAVLVRETDGTIVYWNRAAAALYGYPAAEAIGRTSHDLLRTPPDRVNVVEAANADVGWWDGELTYTTKDGRTIIVESRQALLAGDGHALVVEIDRDITARKLAEEAVEAAQTYGGVALWSWDAATGRYAPAPEMDRLYGIEPGTMRTREDWAARVADGAERAAVEAARDRALAEHAPFRFEYRIRHGSGEERWILSRGRGEYDESGRLLRVFGVNIDITDRKRVEQALQAADRRKDEFLAMLAHELRNPLAPIRTAVQVLRHAGADDQQLAHMRDTIDRQVSHLARLVDDLLEVSRITQNKIALRREAIELMTIVGRAVETSRPAIDERRHRLTVSLPSKPVRVEGDLTRLAQVVSNLLNNAAKYTDEGGSILLAAEVRDREVAIRVKDDGIGIAPDMLPYVFDLFTQADRSLDRAQGGLGIGLTLVRRIVDLHGGRVEASSDGPGTGAEFRVFLPIARDEVRPGAAEAPAAHPADVVTPRRVLVVDDSVDAAESISLLLELAGHETRVAHNGFAAVEAAIAFRPHVVLLDIGLPAMDGYEVARRLRKNPATQHMFIVAVTGYGQPEDRTKALSAGCNHHLTKPVDPDELEALIAGLTDE